MDTGSESYRRYLAGDDEGLAEIVRLYKDRLILFINTYVHDFSAAEDLCEDVFFTLIVKRPHYRGKSAFQTWLFAIARNKALDHLKKQSRHPTAEVKASAAATAESPEELLLSREREREVYSALQALAPQYRDVIYLLYIEGFDREETGRILHKNRRQMQNLCHRARQALRAALPEELAPPRREGAGSKGGMTDEDM
ncbi:MAG TPA: RNA polymerase sigma factor [Candidatus Onthovicinus excrementipullorum]|nr:RNA polymerase sigma factor [Candidatus Onthovicinus excrementipullorum]